MVEQPSKMVLQHKYCTIGKIIEDKARIGPGSYEVQGDWAAQGKLITNWQKPNSDRKSPEPKPGPGQYNPVTETDRKPKTMFIPRNGLRPKPRLYNNGSIKADFVNFDEEIEFGTEQNSPGPGAYMP